ncbi:unnamed protein product [Phytomonas sp. EM1]|nr:unnamed protein product [Phytomonas sp. EM1]|eukprot:CCW59642.1 unnamed protein product [Phytomonas sp. isolate EM1]
MKCIPLVKLAQNVLSLPRLPIPSLEATAKRYRASLIPLQKGELGAQHLLRFETFLGNSAPAYQKQILEMDKAASEAGTYPYTYVESIMANARLSSRLPLEVNRNPGLVLKKGIKGTDGTQVGVAAAIAYGVARWIENLVRNGVEVVDPNVDLSPLETEFGRSLIPSKEKDAIHTTPLTELRHVIVLHDGHPYLVRVFDDNQKVLDRALIQKAFELILSITPDEDNTTPVTVLTAGSRALWGQTYQELISNAENAELLWLFHQSILVICLDSQAWGGDESLAVASALCGGTEEVENRCYDKHQAIVSADGQVAFNLESTTGGRAHWARWIDDVLGILAADAPSGVVSTSGVDGAQATQIMRHLDITYGKSFATHIRTARQEAKALVSNTEVRLLGLPYGSAQLAKMGVSADAFVQIVLHLARYMYHEKLCCTSEICPTTSFFHGATEVLRSATIEMLALVSRLAEMEKAQLIAAAAPEGSPSVQPSTRKEELREFVYKAARRHEELAAEAKCGQGVDRHLLALQHIADNNKDEDALAFFNDAVYKQINTFTLQTSQFTQPWLQYYSFGPATPNGYGLGYVLDEHEIRVSLSAFANSPSTDVVDLTAAINKAAGIVAGILS